MDKCSANSHKIYTTYKRLWQYIKACMIKCLCLHMILKAYEKEITLNTYMIIDRIVSYISGGA